MGEERRDEVEALKKQLEELRQRLDKLVTKSPDQQASQAAPGAQPQAPSPQPEPPAQPQAQEATQPPAPSVRVEARRGPEEYGQVHIDLDGLMNNVTGSIRESVEAVMEGIRGEVERSVLIGPMGIYIGKPREEPEEAFDAVAIASALSALANEQRLRVLHALSRGGKYAGELEQKLPEITASTLSSHLKILQETGLIAQEAVRGRYLITLPGRLALQMASRIAKGLRGTATDEKPAS